MHPTQEHLIYKASINRPKEEIGRQYNNIKEL